MNEEAIPEQEDHVDAIAVTASEKNQQFPRSLFVIALDEAYSFAGLGPELNSAIERTDQEIKELPSIVDKVVKTKERNYILKEIFQAGLVEIYGSVIGTQLFDKILQKIEQVDLADRIPSRLPRKENCFIVYPDTFGGIAELTQVLPLLKKLGITKIHLLPFFDHAGDAGFAPRYHSIEEPLRLNPTWTQAEFVEFVSQAAKYEIVILMDVILNHMAINSPVLDDPVMRKNLLLSWPVDQLPFEIAGVAEDEKTGGTYATLKLKNGETRNVLIMFPENSNPDNPLLVIPESLQSEQIQTQEAYLHTFYEFQADLDFHHPQTFEMVANLLIQAAEMVGRQGQLRGDAMPFIAKKILADVFQNMDTEDGYRLITLFRLFLALYAPDMNMLAEASRPLDTISKYINRVGGAYDFISLPYFLLSIMKNKSELFLVKLVEMINKIGLEGMSKLVVLWNSHDDMPLAELKDPNVKEIWQLLKAKGALPFGQKGNDHGQANGTPKGAAIRLAEICDNNQDKLAATAALTAFTPHGDIFFLYGSEFGLKNSHEALEIEKQHAQQENRKPDTRALIRPKMDPASYAQQAENSVAFGKISQLLTARTKFSPEVFSSWNPRVNGQGLVEIDLVGEKNGQETQFKLVINYSEQAQIFDLNEPNQCLLSSDGNEGAELIPCEFRLFAVD